MINKKYVDSKNFTLDVSEGLDMKGNRVINVADPTDVQQMEAIRSMFLQKQKVILKPMEQE